LEEFEAPPIDPVRLEAIDDYVTRRKIEIADHEP
jgi:hypothetical protein